MQNEIVKEHDPNDLPHFGYVYFLVNAADPERKPVAEAGTYVKIGVSEVPVRRVKSLPIPIDWEGSVLMRFKSRDEAYGAEQVLHRLLASDRDSEWLQIPPSKKKTVHRLREAEAGKTEYFRIEAMAKAQALIASDQYRQLFKEGGPYIPALDLVPRDLSHAGVPKDHHSYEKGCRLLARLASLDAGLAVVVDANPAGDGYRTFVISADHALLQKGAQLALPFSDGRTMPLFGTVEPLQSGSLFTAEIMAARPDNLERGRELGGMTKLHFAFAELPMMPTLPHRAVLTLASLGGLSRTAELSPQLGGNSRIGRRPRALEDHPGLPLMDCAPS